MSEWLRFFWGSRDAGAILDLPWDPAVVAGPTPPQTWTTPSSSPRRVRFGLSVFC